jgi:hypothetical protein
LSSEDDVIDVEEQVCNVGATAIGEQRGVRLGFHKAKGHQVGGKVVVPSSRHLLQTVEGLVEPTHQVGVGRVDESCGLGTVDRLRESVVKESVFDIELVHGPAPRRHQSDHGADGGRLHHGTESLIKVYARPLWSIVTTSAQSTSLPIPSNISAPSILRSTSTSSVSASPLEMLRVLHVSTTSQFVDIFTKGLPLSVFSEFQSSLNICRG